MPRYIDADALLKRSSNNALLDAELCGWNDFVDIIGDAPTLDLVPRPVICGECKYAKKYQKVYLMCLNPDKQCGFVNNDFYCANGKRKEQK